MLHQESGSGGLARYAPLVPCKYHLKRRSVFILTGSLEKKKTLTKKRNVVSMKATGHMQSRFQICSVIANIQSIIMCYYSPFSINMYTWINRRITKSLYFHIILYTPLIYYGHIFCDVTLVKVPFCNIFVVHL